MRVYRIYSAGGSQRLLSATLLLTKCTTIVLIDIVKMKVGEQVWKIEIHISGQGQHLYHIKQSFAGNKLLIITSLHYFYKITQNRKIWKKIALSVLLKQSYKFYHKQGSVKFLQYCLYCHYHHECFWRATDENTIIKHDCNIDSCFLTTRKN